MPKPLVIGHRGAAAEAPENTPSAVRVGLAVADGIEIDVRLSADGVPVVIHDAILDRTTDANGPVAARAAAELAALDAGGGEGVPTLDTMLAAVDGRIQVFCELKVDPGEDALALLEASLSVLRMRDAIGWTAIHSFDHGLVAEARRCEPAIAVAAISPPLDERALGELIATLAGMGNAALSIAHRAATPACVAGAHARGVPVWAWTADEPGDWRRLTEAGVDGIITNAPSALRAWGEGNSHGRPGSLPP